MWHSAKKVLFCILVVLATSGPAYANSKHNFYVLTLSILSYSKWENVSTPTLTRGFKKENIYVIGRGSTQPYVPNTTNENRAINRRVAIVIIP